MITVLGPVVEEILYRVCLFTTIAKKNKIAAHVITALLFAFQHVCTAILINGHWQEYVLMGAYIAFSLTLTIMYEKLKTPVPGIIAHMLGNAIGVLMMLL